MEYALLSKPSRRKLLYVLRIPFALNAPSRGVDCKPAARGERWTLVDNSARSEKFRPFNGNSTICCVWITCPFSLESVSSCAAASLTLTDWVTSPTLMITSTRCLALTSTGTSLVENVEKPGASLVMEYLPTRTLKK